MYARHFDIVNIKEVWHTHAQHCSLLTFQDTVFTPSCPSWICYICWNIALANCSSTELAKGLMFVQLLAGLLAKWKPLPIFGFPIWQHSVKCVSVVRLDFDFLKPWRQSYTYVFEVPLLGSPLKTVLANLVNANLSTLNRCLVTVAV